MFQCNLGDLRWDNEVINDQWYKGLSKELKDSLTLHSSLVHCLETVFSSYKNLDNRVHPRNKERKTMDRQAQYLEFQPHSRNFPEGTRVAGISTPKNIDRNY